MQVLYIPIPTFSRHPWHDDFVEAVAGRHSVRLYDVDRPMDGQFAEIEAVVELGGSVADRAMIDAGAAAGVKLWQISGTGLDHVDVAYFLEKRITLCNTPGQFSSVALAEHALYLMFCLAKKHSEAQGTLRRGALCQPVTDDLDGQTLGLIGFGASGRELAKRAGALGMRLIAVDAAPISPQARDEFRLAFCGGPFDIDRVLAESDFVSLHVPLTSNTRNLIDRRALGVMKRGAGLINIARGELIDEAALFDALASGQLGGAGLDVFAHEPVPANHPLLQFENVVATPHIAGGSRSTSRRRGEACAENVDRVARGVPPLYRITSVE